MKRAIKIQAFQTPISKAGTRDIAHLLTAIPSSRLQHPFASPKLRTARVSFNVCSPALHSKRSRGAMQMCGRETPIAQAAIL
jgi:hypothetical protein